MNNFNQSSTGVNLELNLLKDLDLSHFYYTENFIKISENEYLYTEFGNLSSEYDTEEPEKYTKIFVNFTTIIYINKEEFERVTGAYLKEEELKKDLYNYLFNTPMHCTIKVNTVEYIIEDVHGCFEDNSCDDIKQKIINYCIKNIDTVDKDILKSELEKMLSIINEIEYV